MPGDLLNELLIITRDSDNSSMTGMVREVTLPSVSVEFECEFMFNPGDLVTCNLVNGPRGRSIPAKVFSVAGTGCLLCLLVEQIGPGVDRAPRVVAPGITATVASNGESAVGSVCDVSESGLRIRIFGQYKLGQELELCMESDIGKIFFKGQVARVLSGRDAGSNDIGIHITEIGKLDRARYNHFVECLLGRAQKAI